MENIIIREVEKHEKAIAYAFFGAINPIELEEIVIENYEVGIRALLIFEKGKKVVFERGDVKKEIGFQRYLSWFNQNINWNNKNYIKNILVYDTCGFVEYIEDAMVSTQGFEKEYYLKYGSLIAIVWSLNGKFLSLNNTKKMEQNPVVTDIISELNGKIQYREPVPTEKIKESLNGLVLKAEELDWILQGYTAQKEFIIQNRADIKTLIALCFEGGEGC